MVLRDGALVLKVDDAQALLTGTDPSIRVFFRVSCPTRYRTAPSRVVAPSRSALSATPASRSAARPRDTVALFRWARLRHLRPARGRAIRVATGAARRARRRGPRRPPARSAGGAAVRRRRRERTGPPGPEGVAASGGGVDPPRVSRTEANHDVAGRRAPLRGARVRGNARLETQSRGGRDTRRAVRRAAAGRDGPHRAAGQRRDARRERRCRKRATRVMLICFLGTRERRPPPPP